MEIHPGERAWTVDNHRPPVMSSKEDIKTVSVIEKVVETREPENALRRLKRFLRSIRVRHEGAESANTVWIHFNHSGAGLLIIHNIAWHSFDLQGSRYYLPGLILSSYHDFRKFDI